jgi:long-chain acyl-CoA synthetase
MTPICALRHRANNNSRQVAFIAGKEIWSYQRLASEADRLARALLARGVRQGGRVALHMANLPELAVAYYACFHIGAIAAPLNTRFKTAELRPLLKRLRPSLYLGQARLYPQVAPVEPEILASDARYIVGDVSDDAQAQAWERLFEGADQTSILHEADIDSPAVLLGTSGTTGVPKFVTHTAGTLSAATDACSHLGFEDEQIAINAVPMVHASGLTTFLAGIRFAAPMILFERFDADAVLGGIERHRCSWMLGLPFMFVEMMRAQRTRARNVESLRFCLSGGDVCPAQLQQEFPDVFGVPLRSVWASTEAMVGSLTYGLQQGPVSRIAPGAQVRVSRNDGAPVPQGEVGELMVRGPSVTVGYWEGPGRIAAATHGGWFRTGDLMRRGEKDDLWFVGRQKDLIIRGGSNISPIEVERVLVAHPAVCDAAVVGVPDAALGQRVAALVRLADKSDRTMLDDVIASAKARLADYKVPETLKIVDEIPRNALGKIDRKSLTAMLADARADDIVATAL